MTDTISKFKNIKKYYGSNLVLDNVSFSIKKGEIYGLIGENGAGKSTIMKIIAGLAFPSQGELELFSKTNSNGLKEARRHIGFMIEAPSLDHSMNAKQNLNLFGILKNERNRNAHHKLLELVGLADSGNKKVRNYSLGMKQRLGIAASLIGDPEFLVLDEPINGLDPQGVIEIRNLFIHLNREESKTILLSSHNLAELYQTATQYVFIQKGQIKEIISHDDLKAKCRQYVLLRTSDPIKSAALLEEKLGIKEIIGLSNGYLKLYHAEDKIEMIAKTLQENALVVTNISIESLSLEEYYMQVMKG